MKENYYGISISEYEFNCFKGFDMQGTFER